MSHANVVPGGRRKMTDDGDSEEFPIDDEPGHSALGKALLDIINTTNNPTTKREAEAHLELLENTETPVMDFIENTEVFTGEWAGLHKIYYEEDEG